MKNIYRVEAKVYEENNIDYGFIIADSYKDAMEQILGGYYSEDEVEFITLKYVTDNAIVLVDNKEVADLVEEGMNY